MTSPSVPQHRANDSGGQSSDSGTVAAYDLLPCQITHMQLIHSLYERHSEYALPVSSSAISVTQQVQLSSLFSCFVTTSHLRGKRFMLNISQSAH